MDPAEVIGLIRGGLEIYREILAIQEDAMREGREFTEDEIASIRHKRTQAKNRLDRLVERIQAREG